MNGRIAIVIALLAALGTLCTGCTVTEQEVESTGSGVSAHVEFEF